MKKPSPAQIQARKLFAQRAKSGEWGQFPARKRLKPTNKGVGAVFLREEAERAARLYERFTGEKAEDSISVEIPSLPKSAAIIGSLDGVLYSTVRDGNAESYIHKFNAGSKPILAVSPDGRQLLIIGGRYRFTIRGIVDQKKPRR